MSTEAWTSVIVFLVGSVFGLIVFMQIVYPLFSLVPKVRKILREEEREKSILLSLLLFTPVVWTTVLLFSILVVVRYFPDYWKPYMLGLAMILVFVFSITPGEVDNEFRPFSFLANQFNPAIVLLRNSVYHRQTQSGSFA